MADSIKKGYIKQKTADGIVTLKPRTDASIVNTDAWGAVGHLSTDTVVVSTKTYYTRAVKTEATSVGYLIEKVGDVYYEYTLVASPSGDPHAKNYYELSKLGRDPSNVQSTLEYLDGKTGGGGGGGTAGVSSLNNITGDITIAGDDAHISVSSEGHTITVSSNIVDSSTSAKGIVQLTDSYSAAETTKAATGAAITAAIGTLDVDTITANLGVGKTITALSETDGKIAATATDIQITESQVTGLVNDLAGKQATITDGSAKVATVSADKKTISFTSVGQSAGAVTNGADVADSTSYTKIGADAAFEAKFTDGSAKVADIASGVMSIYGVAQSNGAIEDGTKVGEVYTKGQTDIELNKKQAKFTDGSSTISTLADNVISIYDTVGQSGGAISTGSVRSTTWNVTKEQAEVDRLDERIDQLEQRGRYLSGWNATTHLPTSYPSIAVGETYTYKSGDYYIVSAVGATNYKPAGTGITRTGESTYTVEYASETSEVFVGDTYTYDGTTWNLTHSADNNQTVKAGSVTFSPNDCVNFVAGTNVSSIVGDATLKTITINTVDTNTCRPLSVNNIEYCGNEDFTPLNLCSGTNIALDVSNGQGRVTISATDTGATSVGTSGSGNVFTAASYDDAARKITFTKGLTVTDGATKVEASTTNGNIKINGTETTVYTHPTSQTAHALGLYKVANDTAGHVTNAVAVAKGDLEGLYDNQTVKVGSGTSEVTFGAGDAVSFIAGSNTTVVADTTNKTIQINNTYSYTNPWSLTTTTGSEAVSDGTNSLNVVTRDTAQDITADKTFKNSKLIFKNNAGLVSEQTVGYIEYDQGSESFDIVGNVSGGTLLLKNGTSASGKYIEIGSPYITTNAVIRPSTSEIDLGTYADSFNIVYANKLAAGLTAEDQVSISHLARLTQAGSVISGKKVDGSTNITSTISSGVITLGESGAVASGEVTADYSVVRINKQGIVVAGGQMLEVISSSGSPTVVNGGWFFQED